MKKKLKIFKRTHESSLSQRHSRVDPTSFSFNGVAWRGMSWRQHNERSPPILFYQNTINFVTSTHSVFRNRTRHSYTPPDSGFGLLPPSAQTTKDEEWGEQRRRCSVSARPWHKCVQGMIRGLDSKLDIESLCPWSKTEREREHKKRMILIN